MALLGLSLVLLSAGLASAAPAERPDLDYFQVTNIPLDGNDAPAICNHWLWAQASVADRDGILNMEDVRPGAQPQFHGTTLVSVNGQLVRPTLKTADWWPNKVLRRATVDGIHFQGTVMAAREKYALLNRLVISNATAQPKTITLELSFTPNRGVHGTVEPPSSRSQISGKEVCRFENLVLAPGASRVFRAVNLYRGNEPERDHILARFEQEWQAGDAYWNEMLEDAYTPGPGPFLSGGAPRFVTSDTAAQRFHNFGVITALMLLKRDPDKAAPGNLYVTSMPDEAYGTSSYVWDVGYASELLAMMDPAALRTMIERWALADVHALLSVSYDSSPTGFARGRFYASNGSMFLFNTWNYINYTGDYAWLDKRVGESFRLVSERLEQVYNGLGEIEALASGVGDLRRVLTGVKSRGAVGEIQLGALLAQILSPDQYEAEVTLLENAEPVSFAIRLPGKTGEAVSYLPIDARFPHEAYDRLVDAVESGDAQTAEQAGAELEKKLLRAAERIHTQYIAPPRTTDFAVLFLGSEGLYAEALRRPGLAERMQRDHHVTLTGPSTLAALVNALQMGFRTLALEKRAEEVWALLGAVRGEFQTFAEALGRTQKRIRQASESIEDAAEKSRLIEKRLRGVEKLGTKQRRTILGEEEEDSELFSTDWD